MIIHQVRIFKDKLYLSLKARDNQAPEDNSLLVRLFADMCTHDIFLTPCVVCLNIVWLFHILKLKWLARGFLK